ncbi:MAG: DUF3105 domain-containing protein [Actinomycetota bacterium]|nr:DUF3105 domain-containing protein [Actinomycetota bacterium]
MAKPKAPKPGSKGGARSKSKQASRARASAQGSRRWPFAVALGAVVALGVALVVLSAGGDEEAVAPPGVQSFDVASADHVDAAVTYPQIPPVGGDHNAVWQNCGYYPQPIVTEMGVHSMEHGAVWITYRPDLAEDEVDVLRGRAGSYVLVSPWAEGLPSPVVASAWGSQLPLDSASDPALGAFIDTFRQGPQTPEPGAACRGGAGQPE